MTKVKFILMNVFISLIMVQSAHAAQSIYPIYALTDANTLYGVINGIAALMNSMMFKDALICFGLLGLLFIIIFTAVQGTYKRLAYYLFGMSIFVSMALNAQVSVQIVSELSGETYEVNNVPGILAVPASWMSILGHDGAKIIDQAYASVGGMKSNLTLTGGTPFSISNQLMEDATTYHIKDLQAMTDPYQKQEELNKSPIGNSTWKYLSGMTKQQKIFIMSLIGTTVRTPIQSGNQTDLKQIPVSPSMTTDDLAKLFMFGASSTINQNLAVLECEDKNPYALWQCLAPQTTPIKQSYWYKNESVNANGVSLTDYGFYGLAYGLMFQAIQNVSEGKVLDTPATIILPASIYGANVQVKTNFNSDEIKGFLTLAYLPLYRAINIATFYPDISKQLISNISEVVAAHYATAYLEDYILNCLKHKTIS